MNDLLESKNYLKKEAKDLKRIATWKKKGKKTAEEIAAAEKEAQRKKVKVLLITDSPDVSKLFKVSHLQSETNISSICHRRHRVERLANSLTQLHDCFFPLFCLTISLLFLYFRLNFQTVL